MTNGHLAHIEPVTNSHLTTNRCCRRAIQKLSWRAVAAWTIARAVQDRQALSAIVAVSRGITGGIKRCYEGILEEKSSGDGVVAARFVGPVRAARRRRCENGGKR